MEVKGKVNIIGKDSWMACGGCNANQRRNLKEQLLGFSLGYGVYSELLLVIAS